MEKDNFFDTCVIISYARYSRNAGNKLNLKCYSFVENKKSIFMVCLFVIKELKNFKDARRIINYEIISKAKNSKYEIGDSDISKNLNKNELNKARQLYEKLKNHSVDKILKKLITELTSLEIGIDQFLKFKADEKVISLELIDKKLSNTIYELISNYNDAQILTCAVQEQQDRAIFLFVTIDKEHFNPNAYEFIKTDPRMNKLKFPELKNLIFEE